MGKKAWIVFSIICVLVVLAVLVCMLVLVPQTNQNTTLTEKYQSIAKQDYTFNKKLETLEKNYNVTQKDVDNGKKTDKYEEGNINPFTPKNEVTIYNEPTLKNEGSTELTPDRK